MLLTFPRKIPRRATGSQEALDWDGIEIHRTSSMTRTSSLRQLVLSTLLAIAAIYFLYCVLHGTLTPVTLPLSHSPPTGTSTPPNSPSADVWEALGINRSSTGAHGSCDAGCPPASSAKALQALISSAAVELCERSMAMQTRTQVMRWRMALHQTAEHGSLVYSGWRAAQRCKNAHAMADVFSIAVAWQGLPSVWHSCKRHVCFPLTCAAGPGDGTAAAFEGPLEWPEYRAAVGSRLAAIAAVDDGHWHGGAADDPLSVMDAVAAGHGRAGSERQLAPGEPVQLPNLPLAGAADGLWAAMPANLGANPMNRKALKRQFGAEVVTGRAHQARMIARSRTCMNRRPVRESFSRMASQEQHRLRGFSGAAKQLAAVQDTAARGTALVAATTANVLDKTEKMLVSLAACRDHFELLVRPGSGMVPACLSMRSVSCSNVPPPEQNAGKSTLSLRWDDHDHEHKDHSCMR